MEWLANQIRCSVRDTLFYLEWNPSIRVAISSDQLQLVLYEIFASTAVDLFECVSTTGAVERRLEAALSLFPQMDADVYLFPVLMPHEIGSNNVNY